MSATVAFSAMAYDGPVVMDSDFGLLMMTDPRAGKHTVVLSPCCGLRLDSLTDSRQAEAESTVCVRCGTRYRFPGGWVRLDSSIAVRKAMGELLLASALDPLTAVLARETISDRFDTILTQWLRQTRDTYEQFLIQLSGPLLPLSEKESTA